MKKITAFLIFLFMFSYLFGDNSVFEIKDYSSPLSLTNKKNVAFNHGDNDNYKEIDFDDSTWARISLPSSLHIKNIPHSSHISWFRISILFPNNLPKKSLGINLGVISDCDIVYFNGQVIGQTGKFTHKSHAYDLSRIYEIPTKLIQPGKKNVIAIKVKNYFDYEVGPIRGDMLIGDYYPMIKKYFLSQYSQLFFVFYSLLVGILFLLVFLRNKTSRGTAFLFFSLFTLFHSLFIFLNLDIRLDVISNFVLLKKIEQITIFLLFIFIIHFFYFYFSVKRKITAYIFYILNSIAILLILVTNEPLFWDNMNIFFFEYVWIAQIIFLGYILVKKSFFDKNLDARILLGVYAIFSVTIAIDILIKRNILHGPTTMIFGNFTSIGNFIFLFGFTVVLINHFVKLSQTSVNRARVLKKLVLQLESANQEIEQTYYETIIRLSLVAEYRDTDTGKHVQRVGHYVKFICEKLNIPKEQIESYRYASLMHDVGKVGIPDHILFKRGPLTNEEWEIMKQHSGIGARIFRDSQATVLNLACDIALTHHEKFNGSGYPVGLRGTNIPLAARITALADIYDALRCPRPYKNAFTHEEAKAIILAEEGRVNKHHFDPDVLQVFIDYEQEFAKIYDENADDDEEELQTVS